MLFLPEMDLKNKKILIIKLRYIGDTLSVIPVVENLKRSVPGVSIDVMVHKGTEDVVRFHPAISRLWIYDRKRATKNIVSSILYHSKLIKNIRSESYYAVIDFTLGDRAAFISFMTGAELRITYSDSSRLSHILMNHIILSDPLKRHIVDRQLESLKAMGIKDMKREMSIHIPESVEKDIDGIFDEAKLKNGFMHIAIHPGARGRLRRWKSGRFADIALRLKEAFSANIILIGGPDEAEIVDSVEKEMGVTADLRSTSLSLLHMAALFRRCSLFLGNDSAPGHIAAAVGCPTLSIFGPTFPHIWRPVHPNGEIIFKNFPCCGCRQRECIKPERNCMDSIEVDEVWEKAEFMVRNALR
ncbi:MAG: glycosyltransferase family 9 protein [Deltaproteobacteria bacterium]|nr:glycosyltransferase family 9 protein [Deltaproteobacteria bacterium]